VGGEEAAVTRSFRSLAEIEADPELSVREIEAILDFASSLVEEKAEGGKVVELFGQDGAGR
jgi:hypothetical protein